jgi:hypothetical protein
LPQPLGHATERADPHAPVLDVNPIGEDSVNFGIGWSGGAGSGLRVDSCTRGCLQFIGFVLEPVRGLLSTRHNPAKRINAAPMRTPRFCDSAKIRLKARNTNAAAAKYPQRLRARECVSNAAFFWRAGSSGLRRLPPAAAGVNPPEAEKAICIMDTVATAKTASRKSAHAESAKSGRAVESALCARHAALAPIAALKVACCAERLVM